MQGGGHFLGEGAALPFSFQQQPQGEQPALAVDALHAVTVGGDARVRLADKIDARQGDGAVRPQQAQVVRLLLRHIRRAQQLDHHRLSVGQRDADGAPERPAAQILGAGGRAAAVFFGSRARIGDGLFGLQGDGADAFDIHKIKLPRIVRHIQYNPDARRWQCSRGA